MEQLHARIDENGEIELPPSIRKMLGLKAGSEIMLELHEHEVVLKPISTDSMASAEK